jgi:hypothetical protein
MCARPSVVEPSTRTPAHLRAGEGLEEMCGYGLWNYATLPGLNCCAHLAVNSRGGKLARKSVRGGGRPPCRLPHTADASDVYRHDRPVRLA